MTRIGYFLSSEEFTPAEMIDQARMAQEAGFDALMISDHYHPWTGSQGQSPFVWSMVGALAQAVSLPVTTGVTCPLVRVHPAVIAQAAATSAVLTNGRFTLGVGTGEALNEHILGTRWPVAVVRREMLTEALQIIRALWSGEKVDFHGRFYTVEDARLYTLPETPPLIHVSGFGPKSAELAGLIGDGFICTKPSRELIGAFETAGGRGKPKQGVTKVCWDADKSRAVQTTHERWACDHLPGELNQVLPSPKHFEQAVQLVTKETVAQKAVCGDDRDEHRAHFREFFDAGYDEVYVSQIGPRQKEFFAAYADLLPTLRS